MSNRAKEIAAIMATYEPGQVWQLSGTGDYWAPIDGEPCWDWSRFTYRRKPEPKLREFTDKTVPRDAWFRFNGGGLERRAVTIRPDGVILGCCTSVTTFAALLKEWSHSLDNGKTWHPCGVLEQA